MSVTALAIEAIASPLRIDEHGVVRIGKTRVTLNTIIDAYRLGQTPEEIAVNFSSVTQEQVYATITYYLGHKLAVDAYLDQCEFAAEEMRRKIEAQPGYHQWRDRLLERAKARGLR